MDSKLSKWLEVSTKLLKARIDVSSEKSNHFIEELNLRREAVSDAMGFTSNLSISDIEGVYQIIGANSENSEQGYSGMLTLRYEDNKIYANWLIEGEDVQTGYGLFINNILSLNFMYEQDDIEYSGMVTYQILSNNILYGQWVEEASDSIGLELGRKLSIDNVDPLRYFGFN